MPYFEPFIPSKFGDCQLVARKCIGTLAQQREGLKQLLIEREWPIPTKENSGRPRMGNSFCSLSHGGGWVAAIRGSRPVGVDVEGATERLSRASKKFVGSADQPVIETFGDNLNTLCRLWTAKEAVFKAFGTGVDFRTGIKWNVITENHARLTATAQGEDFELGWTPLPGKTGLTWLAVAAQIPKNHQ